MKIAVDKLQIKIVLLCIMISLAVWFGVREEPAVSRTPTMAVETNIKSQSESNEDFISNTSETTLVIASGIEDETSTPFVNTITP